MDKNLRKERMSELKRRLYSGIPADAGFNVNQLLIVQGLLFDAVDESVAEYERLLDPLQLPLGQGEGDKSPLFLGEI